MSITFRARFTNGVLKPLEDARLKDGDEVLVSIDSPPSASGLDWLEETCGGWRGLVDADELKRNIEESRLFMTRPEPRL